MSFDRSVRLFLTVALLATPGCSMVPGPLRPVRPTPYSAVELKRDVTGPDSAHLDFAADATLLTAAGDTLRGRERILAFMTAPESEVRALGGFQVFPNRFYRCSMTDGIETGAFRILDWRGTAALPASGEWFARWRRSDTGDWMIEEAALRRPGEPLPTAGPDCVGTAQEVAAGARFALSVHGPPFKIDTSHPYEDLDGVIGPPGDRKPNHAPLIFAARYRVMRWVAVSAVWARQRGFKDFFGGTTLRDGGSIIAGTLGYEGRDFSVDAGPALYRSYWIWDDGTGLDPVGAHYSHAGALAQVRFVVPLGSDFNLELLAQRRFVGAERVPLTQVSRSPEGWYLGIGFALRTTEK